MIVDNKAIIRIKSLRTPARIGCTEAERSLDQALEIDLDLEVPMAHSAGREVDLNKSICYLELRNDVRDLVQSKHWILIEELCSVIIDRILAQYELVLRATIRCRKFVLADCICAEIELCRERNEHR